MRITESVVPAAIRSLLIASTMCLLVDGSARADAEPIAEAVVFYRYDGVLLGDSKWGRIADFQRALDLALLSCGKPGIGGADGKFGNRTRDGIVRLLNCASFADLTLAPDHPQYGAIDSALWKRLLPNSAPPTIPERAFALSLTHEATDYDRIEWNYGTADDASALTWGPYGATVGYGHEVRAILKKLQADEPKLLKDAFGEELSTLHQLLASTGEQGYAVLKPVYADQRRRTTWRRALAAVGATDAGRRAYEWYAFESGRWLTPNLRRLYALLPDDARAATEVDYAFFLDLAIQCSVTQERIQAARAAIEWEESRLRRSMTPAERRRTIGRVWSDAVGRWSRDRMGRNVVFYVDAMRQSLASDELSAWKWRTGRAASQYGLSDDRIYVPAFLESRTEPSTPSVGPGRPE